MNALLSERWVPVVGFPDYEVSDHGQVRRSKPSLRNHSPRQLVLRESADGYVRVSLSRDARDRTKLVHRLVLEAFVGPCPDGDEADHVNGRRSDNSIANLRWLPKPENLSIRRMATGVRNGNAKLTPAQVAEARQMVANGASRRSVAKQFGVSSPVIDRIANGIAWRDAQ